MRRFIPTVLALTALLLVVVSVPGEAHHRPWHKPTPTVVAPTATVSPIATLTGGTTLYVTTSGNDANLCTQLLPCKSIIRAAALVTPGATVLVTPGTYSITAEQAIRKGGTSTARVRFVSQVKHGAKLSSTSPDAIIWITNTANYVDLDDFEMWGSGPMGVYNEGAYNRLRGNYAHNIGNARSCDSNGGAGLENANQAGHDNEISNSLVHDIGPAGIACNFYHGIYHQQAGGRIWNNISFNNSGWGIHLWHAPRTTVIANNVVLNNRVGGIVVGAQSGEGIADDITVSNNITMDNSTYGISEEGATGSNNRYLNNNLYRNGIRLQTGVQSGTMSVDPLFVDTSYHLSSTSPLIDRGTPTGAPDTDMDGQTRPLGIGYDVGPDEVR